MELRNLSKRKVNILNFKQYKFILEPGETITLPKCIDPMELEPIVRAFKDLKLLLDSSEFIQPIDADEVDGKHVDDTVTTTNNLWTAQETENVIDAKINNIENNLITDIVNKLGDEIDGGTF